MTIYNRNEEYTPVTSEKKLSKAPLYSYFAHNVLVENPDPQSMASLILLKRGLDSRKGSRWLHKASRNKKRSYMRKCFREGTPTCFKCGIRLVRPHKDMQHGIDVASVDHISPITLNPELARDDSNFRLACQRCNSNSGAHLG